MIEVLFDFSLHSSMVDWVSCIFSASSGEVAHFDWLRNISAVHSFSVCTKGPLPCFDYEFENLLDYDFKINIIKCVQLPTLLE